MKESTNTGHEGFDDEGHPSPSAAPATTALHTPTLPGIGPVMRSAMDAGDVSGGVTVVATRDGILHLEATGQAEFASGRPMRSDSIFWIASMTKPVTGAAVLMLQDEGKLSLADPIARYIPAFAALKTPAGARAEITLGQALTHTSGLGEANTIAARGAHTLADMIPLYLAAPMQYEPGARWHYTQSGINVAAHIVEIVSGLSFDVFLQERLFDPLGMRDTTFYPSDKPPERMVVGYATDRATRVMQAAHPPSRFGVRGRPPLGHAGLFSTGPDYARFGQMLLAGGTFGGRSYLSPGAIRSLTTIQTGDLPCGFFLSKASGDYGANYGWGIGTCVLRRPHEGAAARLSPGTFGHGGAWGTQAWMDPVRGVAYILMIQRPNGGNPDASELRRAFQQAAADALTGRP